MEGHITEGMNLNPRIVVWSFSLGINAPPRTTDPNLRYVNEPLSVLYMRESCQKLARMKIIHNLVILLENYLFIQTYEFWSRYCISPIFDKIVEVFSIKRWKTGESSIIPRG